MEAVKHGNPLDWVCAPCSQQQTLHSFHADVPSLNSPFQPPVDSTHLSTSFPCNMMDGLLSQLDLASFHVPDISVESSMDDTQPVADIPDGSNDFTPSFCNHLSTTETNWLTVWDTPMV